MKKNNKQKNQVSPSRADAHLSAPQKPGSTQSKSSPRGSSLYSKIFNRGNRNQNSKTNDDAEAKGKTMQGHGPGGQQAGPIRIMSPPIPAAMIQKATSPAHAAQLRHSKHQQMDQQMQGSSSTDSLGEGVKQESSYLPHNSKRRSNMVNEIPKEFSKRVPTFNNAPGSVQSSSAPAYEMNTGKITTVSHQKQQAILLEQYPLSTMITGRNLTSQISQSNSEQGTNRFQTSYQKSQTPLGASNVFSNHHMSTNMTQHSHNNKASMVTDSTQVNQVKIPLKLQTVQQNDQAPTVISNGQESDVAVSPSPDRKVWVQNKAINMPHDTSKLRGMAVRKHHMQQDKAQTPVYDKFGFGARKMDSHMAIEYGSRMEEFNATEQNKTAVQFEKKLLPKVSPQSKFKMLKQNFRQNQSGSDWSQGGKQFNFKIEEDQGTKSKEQSQWGHSANTSRQSLYKLREQLKMIPSRISENPMSASIKESSGEYGNQSSTPTQVLNKQMSENIKAQPTILNHVKNMLSDFIDGKKGENGEKGASSQGEEMDAKVYMSDTDEDGSQISPIQTFKVNQNRKQQIVVTHEDQFSPDSDQVGESSGHTHERHSVHQSIKGFSSPNKNNKLVASRDSGGLAKPSQSGLFSDIFNFKYMDSANKNQESMKSDSVGAIITREEKQQDDQYRTFSPQFKNEPSSANAPQINNLLVNRANEAPQLRGANNVNYQTFNIKLNKVNQPPGNPNGNLVESKSEFIHNKKLDDDVFQNQDVRLKKLAPKTGMPEGLVEAETTKSQKLELKKLSEDLPKQKNVLQRIQNFFNKDQEKGNKDDAGSEDVDELNQDDEQNLKNKNKEKISSLEINAKQSKKQTNRNRDTSLQPNLNRQASPLIQEKKKKNSSSKKQKADNASQFQRPQQYSIFYSNTSTLQISQKDLEMPKLNIKVFRNYFRRIKQFEFTSDRSRIVVIWKVIRRDIIVSNYETKELEEKLSAMEQNIKWLSKKKQKKDTSNEQHIKMMISDQKVMKQLLQECRQPREIKEVEQYIECLKDVKDEPEEDQQIFNLKTTDEIQLLFQDGFTVHDGKTLKKLIDFSKKGFQDLSMKASTRNHSDFSIHHVSLHDQLPHLMAIVFNDNKSRCELYNLECEHFKETKVRKINTTTLFYDDSLLIDQMQTSPTRCDFFNSTIQRNSRYRKKTETINFHMRPLTKLKNSTIEHDNQQQQAQEFEYIGSITPRPFSNSYKCMQDTLQDFSIFHQPYDTSQQYSAKKDDQYKYENSDNLTKVQSLRQKQRMSAVRPFLYLQEEGEIVMVKLIGKRWIIVGARKVKEDGTTRGHITIWERQSQKPKLKVFMTQVCLDGRFWIKQSALGLDFLQMAFVDVQKEETTTTEENKKEVHVAKIYDFQEKRVTHKLEPNWLIGNVIFTQNQQRLIVQSIDGQYIFVYSLTKKYELNTPIQKFKQKQSLDQKDVIPLQLIELNFDDVIKQQSSTPDKQYFRINMQMLLSQNNNTNQIQIFLILPDFMLLKQEAEEQKRLLNQILNDGQTQTTLKQWITTNIDHYIPDFIMYGPSMQVNLNQLLGSENSLLLIKEEYLTQKKPKVDEKQINELAEDLKDKCQSKLFSISQSERDQLIEKVAGLVPVKTRKAHNIAKFCSFSQSSNDPSKVLSIVTETGRFIQLNIPLEDILKSHFLMQQKEMQSNLDNLKKHEPENEDIQKIKVNLKLHPILGYATHLPTTSSNYYASIVKPEAYLRHQKCLEELHRKPHEAQSANVKKLMGSGCIQIGESYKRMDSKWIMTSGGGAV